MYKENNKYQLRKKKKNKQTNLKTCLNLCCVNYIVDRISDFEINF